VPDKLLQVVVAEALEGLLVVVAGLEGLHSDLAAGFEGLLLVGSRLLENLETLPQILI